MHGANYEDENSLDPTQCVSVQSEGSSNPLQPPPEIPQDNSSAMHSLTSDKINESCEISSVFCTNRSETINESSENSSMLCTDRSDEKESGSKINSENNLLCSISSITKCIQTRPTCPCLKPVVWDEVTEPCCCCCPRPNKDVTRRCCCSCWNWGIFNKETENVGDEKLLNFLWWDFIFGVFGIGLYVLDIVTDLWVAYTLFSQGFVAYFISTLAFVFPAYVANVVMLLVSHISEDDFNGIQWIPVIFVILLNMGPCISTGLFLFNGCKSRQTSLSSQTRKSYAMKTKDHMKNSLQLRVFEGCLEAAPQLVLQLYLLVLMPEIHGTESVMRVLSILSSWFSISLTLVNFNKVRHENSKYNTRHMIFDFLRRLAETGGRVLSIALFTSVFGLRRVLAFLVPHVVIMFIWYCWKNKSLSKGQVIFSLMKACFSIFAFDADLKHTKIHYLVFYVLSYGENVAMLLLWYLYAEGPVDWVRPWGLVVGLVFLPLHVGLLLLYYGLCHPSSENIRNTGRAQWCDKNVWKAAMCEKVEMSV